MFGWLFAALLTASSTPVQVDLQIEAPEQVMLLPAELQTRLNQEVLAGSPSQRARLDRLLRLLFGPGGLALDYAPDATESVAQTYATRTTNCMSFTLLFVALARQAGLEAHPQEIPETVGWRQDSGIIYRMDHINAIVRIGKADYLVDIAGHDVITVGEPKTISDQRLLAHYYNNLAMRDLEEGRIAPALQKMDTALRLDPGYATNWSNAGVLYLRNGDKDAAEHAYAKALALEPANSNALANLANLAEIEGDRTREAGYRQRLERLEQADPVFHFIQAAGYEQAGDYARAIEHYQRAIQLHDDESRFHAALAHAYALAGDTHRAIRELGRAEWLSSGTERDQYRAQIEAMRGNGKSPGAADNKALQ